MNPNWCLFWCGKAKWQRIPNGSPYFFQHAITFQDGIFYSRRPMVPQGSKWACLKIGYPLNRVTDIDWSSYPFSDTSKLHCCLKHHMFVFISHSSQHVQYIPIHSNMFQYIPIYFNIIIPMYISSILQLPPRHVLDPFRYRRPDQAENKFQEIRNHRWSLQVTCHEMSMFSSYLISVNK